MALTDKAVMFEAKRGPSFRTFSFIDPRVKLPGQGATTSEAIIVPTSGADFAQSGDSGAFVLNEQRLLVGNIDRRTKRCWPTPGMVLCNSYRYPVKFK